MDLIFADKNGIEQGYILDYDLDIAFGCDENDFSITLDIQEHCCKEGYSLYIENTEYGGIVDKIIPNTKSGTVTYEGRTWHGIIENKIIEPDAGENYKIVKGEANAVLAALISDLGLSSLFSVSNEESSVYIGKHQFERYTHAYSGILDMLFTFKGKLKFSHLNGIVNLSAVPLYDYSQDEEWDSSQFDFSIEKNYRPVNHLIGLGGGDLKERRVIHIFTDENGGIQPYAKKTNPVADSDYILDKSKQLIFGANEVADTYDYGNAATTENYVLLTSQPSNWKKRYTNFFYKSDDKYVQNEQSYSTGYTLLSSQPSDWSNGYGRYFLKDGDNYKSVEGVEVPSYSVLNSKPADWENNFSNYFCYWSDGVNVEYRNVTADKYTKYNLQTTQPSDWNTNFSNYFTAKPKIVYEYTVKEMGDNGIWKLKKERLSSQEQAVSTAKKKYCSYKKIVTSWTYIKISGDTAPVWKKKTYYTSESVDVAPTWQAGTYYSVAYSTTAPAWASGTYYTESTTEVIPVWKKGTFYQKFVDNYADLVTGCLKRLKELNNSDKIGISLDAEQEYDINDIVGAKEKITGISVAQAITKKIVKIKNGSLEISYEIGE